MAALTAGGPALVHFFDFAQLNSVRALPYPVQWASRYAESGLSVIGIQAPRFEFGADPEAVRAGLERLGVSHPVAIDAEHEIWNDYGCQGWPSMFLWGQGGVLRWYHFGEGDYRETEEAIQEELRADDALRELPAPVEPLRPSDAPGAAVIPPTAEMFPGDDGTALRLVEGDPVEVEYEGAGAYATLEGTGTLEVAIDGRAAGTVRAEGAGLYELSSHPRHERHRLRLALAEGDLTLWSLSFAPGVP